MLPCPFCNSESIEVLETKSDAYVTCCSCYAHGPIGDDALPRDATVLSAIRKWDKALRNETNKLALYPKLIDSLTEYVHFSPTAKCRERAVDILDEAERIESSVPSKIPV